MGVSLQVPNNKIQNMFYMKDGELGVLISFPGSGKDLGSTVVQRYKDNLIIIGQRSGLGWSDFFSVRTPLQLQKYLYRPLEPGELIEVTRD